MSQVHEDHGGLSSSDETTVGNSQTKQCLPITPSTVEDKNHIICEAMNHEGDKDEESIIPHTFALLSQGNQAICASNDDVNTAYIPHAVSSFSSFWLSSTSVSRFAESHLVTY